MEKNELTGTVIFQKTNANSKSESMQPFLYVNQNEIFQLYLENSNPFENNQLQKYDGKNITATGHFNEVTFIASQIKEN